MAIWTIGINHHTAALDLRARFAFAPEEVRAQLLHLRQVLGEHFQIPVEQVEVCILSTCNRTEIYCAILDDLNTTDLSPKSFQNSAIESNHHKNKDFVVIEGVKMTQEAAIVMKWLAERAQCNVQTVVTHSYHLQNTQVARHVFSVASGLDSMVLGESQILGQLKDAVRMSSDENALGVLLNQLFQRCFAVAKQVRSSTDIGAHAISMAAASVRLSAQLFENLQNVKILFVGAGEMIDLAAAHFCAQKPKSVTIANRGIMRAQQLCERLLADHPVLQVQTMALAQMPQMLHAFDIVISCTASTVPLIGLGAVEQALKKRKRRPIFMVDLAVPRDIEPQVANLSDVYLYTIDDLAHVVQAGHAQRQAAVEQAKILIDAGVEQFEHWLGERAPGGSIDLIQRLNEQMRYWREEEVIKAMRLLAKGQDVEMAMQSLAKSLTQKMLHPTLKALRSNDANIQREASKVALNYWLKQEH